MKIPLIATCLALGLSIFTPAMAIPNAPIPTIDLTPPQLVAHGHRHQSWHHVNRGRHLGWERGHRHKNSHRNVHRRGHRH